MDSHNWSLEEKQWEREYDNRIEEYRMHHITSKNGIEGVVLSDHTSKESFILVAEDCCVDIDI